MADQIFNVSCGFFNAVDNDRTYDAEQMNKPYKRLISNGVFATPQGTPSTDLQVVSASNRMSIICKAGQGLFADKWFENGVDIPITVPANNGVVPRVDSVIAQVDTRSSGRVGNIVYREGEGSSNPVAPAINTVTGVMEYRLANIYVAPNANAINNDAITDMRGSSSCPWVTSLIYQVDTSVLFEQWQTAYEMYYNESTEDFEEYTSEQRTAWEAFLSGLTDDLTVNTDVVMYTSKYTTVGSTTNIPINIASYDQETDILMVYINGLLGSETDDYTVNSEGTAITLQNALSAGNDVNFIVLKSIISADIQSAVSLIQTLDARLSSFMSDSGWINFTLESGATAFDSNSIPAVRCIGDRVYLRGAFKGVTTLNKTICTLPVAYRPAMNHQWTTAAISGTTVQGTVVMEAQTGGSIKLLASSGSLSSTAEISIATSWALQ